MLSINHVFALFFFSCLGFDYIFFNSYLSRFLISNENLSSLGTLWELKTMSSVPTRLLKLGAFGNWDRQMPPGQQRHTCQLNKLVFSTFSMFGLWVFYILFCILSIFLKAFQPEVLGCFAEGLLGLLPDVRYEIVYETESQILSFQI